MNFIEANVVYSETSDFFSHQFNFWPCDHNFFSNKMIPYYQN